jgi:hypothetical protein
MIMTDPKPMTKTGMQQVGRLALRVEGQWWCAYYAQPDSMAKAARLAKIHMSVVVDEKRKRAFMDLMSSFVADMIEQQTGKRPDMRMEDAPAHEKKH